MGTDWPGSRKSYSSTAPTDMPRSDVGSEHEPQLPNAPACGSVVLSRNESAMQKPFFGLSATGTPTPPLAATV